MNFIAGAIFYHASEVCTFWIMIGFMEKFGMKDIFRWGLPGLKKHDEEIERLGKMHLNQVFKHFVSITYISFYL